MKHLLAHLFGGFLARTITPRQIRLSPTLWSSTPESKSFNVKHFAKCLNVVTCEIKWHTERSQNISVSVLFHIGLCKSGLTDLSALSWGVQN